MTNRIKHTQSSPHFNCLWRQLQRWLDKQRFYHICLPFWHRWSQNLSELPCKHPGASFPLKTDSFYQHQWCGTELVWSPSDLLWTITRCKQKYRNAHFKKDEALIVTIPTSVVASHLVSLPGGSLHLPSWDQARSSSSYNGILYPRCCLPEALLQHHSGVGSIFHWLWHP